MTYYWYIWDAELKAGSEDFGALANAMDGEMKTDFRYFTDTEDLEGFYGIDSLKTRALTDYELNHMSRYKKILQFLSKYHVLGYVHVRGEEGQHVKYVLDGKGQVREYECNYVFNDQKGRMLVKKDYLKNIIHKYYERALAHHYDYSKDGTTSWNNYYGDQADGFHALAYALFPNQFDRIKQIVNAKMEKKKNGG